MRTKLKRKLSPDELKEQLDSMGFTPDDDRQELHGFTYTMDAEHALAWLGDALASPSVYRITPAAWYLGPVNKRLLIEGR